MRSQNRTKRDGTYAQWNYLNLSIGRRITVDFFEERKRGEHVHEAEAALAAGGLGERGGQHHHHRGDLLEEEPPQVAPERIHRAKTLAGRAGGWSERGGRAKLEGRLTRGRGRDLWLRGKYPTFAGIGGGGRVAVEGGDLRRP